MDRAFREEVRLDLQRKLASQDPHKFGEAAGKMEQTHTQAAELAAKLLDKLAATLADSLKELALRLESELATASHPLTEKVFEGAGHYRTEYTLHSDPLFNHAQLRLELVRHCADRLRDQKHVGSGCAGEFDTLRWCIGERIESPLSI